MGRVISHPPQGHGRKCDGWVTGRVGGQLAYAALAARRSERVMLFLVQGPGLIVGNSCGTRLSAEEASFPNSM